MKKNFNTNNQEQKNIDNITTTEGETIMTMNGTKVIKVICYWLDAFANVAGKYGNYTDHIRIQCEKREDAIATAKKILEENPGCDDVEIDTFVRGLDENGRMDRFFLPEAEHIKREAEEQTQEQEQEQEQETETETNTNMKGENTMKKVTLKNRDKFIEELTNMIVKNEFERRPEDIDIYLYIGEGGEWELKEFENPGGNSYLPDDHLKIWTIKEGTNYDEYFTNLESELDYKFTEEERIDHVTERYHEMFEDVEWIG